ncbi:MAG: proton-conducting transporter membrane subunit [bacterium]
MLVRSADSGFAASELLTGIYIVSFSKILFFAVVFFVILLWVGYKEEQPGDNSFFFVWLLLNLMSSCAIISSGNLLLLYCAFELFTLSSVFLILTHQNIKHALEAGIKFLILSLVGSAFILLSLSFVYGIAGTIDIIEISHHLKESSSAHVLLVLILLSGIALKLGVVPFHYWFPDVVKVAPIPIAAYFSLIPVSIFVILVFNTFGIAFSDMLQKLSFFYALLAVLSLVVGNLFALKQSDIKRLIAYSAILQSGFVLLGLAGGVVFDWKVIIYCLAVYLLMHMGLFSLLAAIHKSSFSFKVSSLNGLAKSSLFLALLALAYLCVFMGIPLSGSFLSRVYLLVSAIKAQWFILAGIVFFSWIFSLIIYLKLIKSIFSEPIEGEVVYKINYLLCAVSLICLICLVVLGVFPDLVF